MSIERKKDLLKNSLVLRVQKDAEWTKSVEDAVRDDIGKILAQWLEATSAEGIGPKEVVSYLERLSLKLLEEKILIEEKTDAPA